MKENLVIRVPGANLMLILCNEGLEFSNKNKNKNKQTQNKNKQTNKQTKKRMLSVTELLF